MFTAKSLLAADARVAYPLVACRYPGLTLDQWTAFVRRSEKDSDADRLLALVDSRGRHHAVFGYRVVRAPDGAARLEVSRIALFQLAGTAIDRAFDSTLDTLARDHHCRDVAVDPLPPIDDRAKAARHTEPHHAMLSIEPAAEPPRGLN